MAISYHVPNLTHKNMYTRLQRSLLSRFSRQLCPFLVPSSNHILHFFVARALGDAGVQPLARRSLQRMGLLEAGQRRRRARGGSAAATVGVSKRLEQLRTETEKDGRGIRGRSNGVGYGVRHAGGVRGCCKVLVRTGGGLNTK